MKNLLQPLALTLVATLLASCEPSLGECDIASARRVVYTDDDQGLPAYEGQALLEISCGSGAFCHSENAGGVNRYGAPAGLDFDLQLATSEASTERLRRGQLSAFTHRRAIARTIHDGTMPPGDVGVDIAASGASYRGLPSLTSEEGVAIMDGWLACKLPVVERTTPRPAGIVPVGAIIEATPSGACTGDRALCDGRCVSTGDNPAHCGGCGNVCRAGVVCAGGRCAEGCAAPLQACGESCVDLTSDPQHCGGCGEACGADQFCIDSTCQTLTECPEGLVECGAACVDVNDNALHCGECDNACAAGVPCEAGACACGDTRTDPENCGSCGNVCEFGFDCVAGDCACTADTETDSANCGRCGVMCGVGTTCLGGACVCAEGTTECGSVCVDLATDTSHCGTCNRACSAGQACTDGSCSRCGDGVSFARDVEPIFTSACVDGMCHGGRRPASGLDLSEGIAFRELSSEPSECGSALVVPGDVDRSYLINKLEGRDLCRGNQMPLRAPPLSPAELATIRSWICGGARDD